MRLAPRAASTECPQALIRSLSCFYSCLATSKYLSLLYLGETLPLSAPLHIPWASLLFPISTELPGERNTAGGGSYPQHPAPPTQKGQAGGRRLTHSFSPSTCGRLKQRVDNGRMILQLHGGARNKQCHFTRPLTKHFHLLQRSTQTTVNPLGCVGRGESALALSPAGNQLRFTDSQSFNT